ncbi:MAG: type II toxin-antitoxin system VapC family toxin [Actinomycetota bacterium]|nr:type II toxin-antitoxin system VapC family toxin [Rubrobacter sp.]MDQ3509387.1 type II toxin-antitoxin system VapC family toxin [Actinomycetota bacterium]
MIVLDASAAVDVLLNIGASARIRARIEAEDYDGVRVPHLFEVEVLHTLRREYLRGLLSEERSKIALYRLSTMKLTRHPHTPFIERIWELRENVAAYDAAYIALAETLGAPLITTDGPLARSSGHRANIELFE